MLKMYRFQLNVIHHNKNLEDLKTNSRRQPRDANNEMTDMLKTSSKDLKRAIKRNVLAGNYKWAWNKGKKIESLSKEIESNSIRCKEETNGNFVTEKYNNQNEKLNGQAQKQNEGERGKNQRAGKQSNRNHPIWVTENRPSPPKWPEKWL